MKLISGRTLEQKILRDCLESGSSELIAIYGRRRVGKTFLIRETYKQNIVFEFTGIHNVGMNLQLTSFHAALKTYFGKKSCGNAPATWFAAFELLKKCLEKQKHTNKKVLFFDEFPWIHTRKSSFLETFENFWNTWAGHQSDYIVVVCGSAASWMIQKVINNKGGLHNRLTRRIRLMPFTLGETEQFLKSRKILMDRYQILQLYMITGGIPQYLKLIEKGESAAQAIDRMCFTRDGFLLDEFRNLYASLFAGSADHEKIIEALATKPSGLTRNQLIRKCRIASGGTYTMLLSELEESGFIYGYIPFGKKSSDKVYKLNDEYSFFYLKFIRHSHITGSGTWLRLASSNAWKIWSGFAFERVCLKHIHQIEVALGISGVQTNSSVWLSKSKNMQPGAQIDLLIDRADHCINICEMKFSADKFNITGRYATELENKLKVFRRETSTPKTLFLSFITTYGVQANQFSSALVQHNLKADILFQ